MSQSNGDVSKLTVKQLKKRLKKKGLPVSGRKAKLVQRLRKAEAPKRRKRAKSVSPVRCTKGRGKKVYYFDPDTGKRVSQAEAERRGVQECVSISERKKERKKTPRKERRPTPKRKPKRKPPTRLPVEPVEPVEEPGAPITLPPAVLSVSEPGVTSEVPIRVEELAPELVMSLSTTELDVFETAKAKSESVGNLTDQYAIVSATLDPVYRVYVPNEFKGEETITSPDQIKALYEKYGVDPIQTREYLLLVPPLQLDEVLSLGEKFRNPPEDDPRAVAEEIRERLSEMATEAPIYEIVTAYRDPVFDVIVPLEKIGEDVVVSLEEAKNLYEKYGVNPLKTGQFLLLVPPTRLIELLSLGKKFLTPVEEDPRAAAEELRERLNKIAVVVIPTYAALSVVVHLDREEVVPMSFLGEDAVLTLEQMEGLYQKYEVGPKVTGQYILLVPPNFADNLLQLGELYLDPTEDLESLQFQIIQIVDQVGKLIRPPGELLFTLITAVMDDVWGVYVPLRSVATLPLEKLETMEPYEEYGINPEIELLFLVSSPDAKELMRFSERFLTADNVQKQRLIDEFELLLPTTPLPPPGDVALERQQRRVEAAKKLEQAQRGEYDVVLAYEDDYYGVPVPEQLLAREPGTALFGDEAIDLTSKYDLAPEATLLLVRPELKIDLMAVGEEFKEGTTAEKEEIALDLSNAIERGIILVL